MKYIVQLTFLTTLGLFMGSCCYDGDSIYLEKEAKVAFKMDTLFDDPVVITGKDAETDQIILYPSGGVYSELDSCYYMKAYLPLRTSKNTSTFEVTHKNLTKEITFIYSLSETSYEVCHKPIYHKYASNLELSNSEIDTLKYVPQQSPFYYYEYYSADYFFDLDSF